MKRIIMLLMCFGILFSFDVLKAQNVEESLRMLNDSIVLYEKKSTDIVVDWNTKKKDQNYKLKIPKIVDFNVKNLSREDEVFFWIKIISVKKACKGTELLKDSLFDGKNIVVRLEQYDVMSKDTIK